MMNHTNQNVLTGNGNTVRGGGGEGGGAAYPVKFVFAPF